MHTTGESILSFYAERRMNVRQLSRRTALVAFTAVALLSTVRDLRADEDAASEPPAEGRVMVLDVSIEGNTVLCPEELRWFALQYEGRSLTVAEMQAMARELRDRYVSRGYATTQVIVPTQEVVDGVLEVEVLEGRVGRVEVTDNAWFSAENYLPYLPAENELLNMNELRDGLRHLNRHPDRQGRAVLAAGQEPGTTDIKLHAREDHPFHFSLRYDNEGTPDTPRSRTYLTVQHDNLFGRSQVGLFQFGTAPGDNDKVRQYAGTYYVPLAPLGGPVGHSVTAYAGYSRSATETILNAFSLSGRGTVLGAQYTLPLPDALSFHQHLSLGAEYQEIKDDIGFGGAGLKNTVHTLPLRARWSATRRHDDGLTSLSAGVRWQRDELYRDFDQGDYEQSRAGADTDFLAWTLAAERLQHIGAGWTASASAAGQLSNDRLLPSQQFGLGGRDTVRGYRTRIVTADEALNVRGELRTPVLPPVLPEDAREQTQLLAFLDYGWGNNRNARPGEMDTENLLGVGLGTRLGLFDGALTGRVDVAWALADIGATDHNEKGDCVVHLGFEWRY